MSILTNFYTETKVVFFSIRAGIKIEKNRLITELSVILLFLMLAGLYELIPSIPQKISDLLIPGLVVLLFLLLIIGAFNQDDEDYNNFMYIVLVPLMTVAFVMILFIIIFIFGELFYIDISDSFMIGLYLVSIILTIVIIISVPQIDEPIFTIIVGFSYPIVGYFILTLILSPIIGIIIGSFILLFDIFYILNLKFIKETYRDQTSWLTNVASVLFLFIVILTTIDVYFGVFDNYPIKIAFTLAIFVPGIIGAVIASLIGLIVFLIFLIIGSIIGILIFGFVIFIADQADQIQAVITGFFLGLLILLWGVSKSIEPAFRLRITRVHT